MARDGREDDREAFERAMSGVQPIERDRHTPKLLGRSPVPLSEHDREVLRELDALVSGSGTIDLQDPDDRLEGKVPGLDPRTFQRLKRGEFTVQEDLDLHGTDSHSARELVERFLLDRTRQALKEVRSRM